jgi:hypothetical protein
MASGTLLISAARTVTEASADQDHSDFGGGHVIVNVTAAGTSTLTVTIQGKDPLSGNYYTILAGTALTGTGMQVLKVYPGIAASAGGAVSDMLPDAWRVSAGKGDASSWTFSVSYSARSNRTR